MEPGHWIILTLIVTWAVVMLGGMWQANQKELMKHRERLAMIEKGLPPPEEPARALPVAALMGTAGATTTTEKERQTLEFIRFIGILTIAAGIGLWFLLMLVDHWNVAIGVGGMIVIVGAALLVTTRRAIRLTRDDR